jgi:hypothetical protein
MQTQHVLVRGPGIEDIKRDYIRSVIPVLAINSRRHAMSIVSEQEHNEGTRRRLVEFDVTGNVRRVVLCSDVLWYPLTPVHRFSGPVEIYIG